LKISTVIVDRFNVFVYHEIDKRKINENDLFLKTRKNFFIYWNAFPT